MFGWVKRLWETRLPEPTLEQRLEAKIRQRVLESALSMYDQYVDPREPFLDDGDFFYPVTNEHLPTNIDNRGRGEALPVYLTPYGLKLIRDYSRRQCANNEFAINALTNRVSYTVGRGMTYRAGLKQTAQRNSTAPEKPGDVPFIVDQAQQVIDAFIHRNGWGELEQEIVWRCDRDGEAFVRLFHDTNGNVDVRIVEPEHVKEPGNPEIEDTFGVRTRKGDVCDIEGYWIVENPDESWEPTFVKAEEVLHIKLNTDRNSKRGLSTLFPVRKNLERAEKLLRNMSMLVQVQSTYAVIRKHQGASVGAITSFRDAKSAHQIQDPITGRRIDFSQLQPGSIIDTTPFTSYEFPSAGVNAGAFVEVLQAELRAIAARFSMPEYMLTSNAQNANYASTQVAESPGVKNFERLQSFFADKFGNGQYRDDSPQVGVMWRVLKAAVDANRLPELVLDVVELKVIGPTLVVRDRNQETQRLSSLNQAGILSKETWTQEEGYDYGSQQSQIAREAPPQGDEGQGGGAMGGMMGMLGGMQQ